MDWAFTIALRDRTWIGTQWAALAGDAAFLVVATAISLKTTKFWPLFAAAFALLAVVTHVGRTIDPHVRPWAYATAQVIWTQLILVAIGVGALNAWLGERRQRAASRSPSVAR